MSSTIGLKNLGNTCYLNVALQSLLSLTHFKVILESFREPKPEVILFLLSCLVTSPYSIRSPESVYELYLALHHNTRHMPEDAVECLLRLIQYFEDNLQIQKQKINQHYQGCSCTTFWFENYSSIVHDVFIGIVHLVHSKHNDLKPFKFYLSMLNHVHVFMMVLLNYYRIMK